MSPTRSKTNNSETGQEETRQGKNFAKDDEQKKKCKSVVNKGRQHINNESRTTRRGQRQQEGRLGLDTNEQTTRPTATNTSRQQQQQDELCTPCIVSIYVCMLVCVEESTSNVEINTDSPTHTHAHTYTLHSLSYTCQAPPPRPAPLPFATCNAGKSVCYVYVP